MQDFTAEFVVSTARFKITAPTYRANNETFVKTDEFRQFPSFGHPKLDEWKQDTANICQELSKTNLDYKDFIDSFLIICRRHLAQYGRLIDSDLYNYADETLLIIKGLVSIDGSIFNKSEGEDLWEDLQRAAFELFGNHIWVHQFSHDPIERTKLMKLSDVI